MIKSMLLIASLIFLKANAFASLTVHPQILYDTLSIGTTSNILIHIKNIGPSGSLSYQLSASETWIRFDKTSGVINLNDSVEVTVQIDATQLNVGTYETSIIVGDPHHGPLTIPVSILVQTVLNIDNPSVGDNALLRVYPNPFYSTTNISYSLSNPQNVQIELFDSRGSYVTTIVNGIHTEGEYMIQFDSSMLPSGIYFLSMKTPTINVSKVLLLSK
jgi:hypothetical protein